MTEIIGIPITVLLGSIGGLIGVGIAIGGFSSCFIGKKDCELSQRNCKILNFNEFNSIKEIINSEKTKTNDEFIYIRGKIDSIYDILLEIQKNRG